MKEISITIVSSLLSAFILFVILQSMGFLQKEVADSQIQEIAFDIVNKEKYRSVLVDKMKLNKEFKGQTGDKGNRGDKGLKGDKGDRGPKINLAATKCRDSSWIGRASLQTDLICQDGEFLKAVRYKHKQHDVWWKEEVQMTCCSLN